MPVETSRRSRLAAQFAVAADQVVPVSGGSSPAFKIHKGSNPLFIKWLPDEAAAAAEADGLSALAGGAFRVPQVTAIRSFDDGAALILEWLPLAPLLPEHRPALVAALREMHERGRGQPYGWGCDNRIGPARQLNHQDAHWGEFFSRQRLQPQLSWARDLPADLGTALSRVVNDCASLLPPNPPPALLHGDLWRGNLAWCEGRPALYDPAVYVGDAQVDLAMLKLFGEPVPGLVGAYRAACAGGPVAPDWPLRERVYDLYHLLNHYNLFGNGWLTALAACCRTLTEGSTATHEGGC